MCQTSYNLQVCNGSSNVSHKLMLCSNSVRRLASQLQRSSSLSGTCLTHTFAVTQCPRGLHGSPAARSRRQLKDEVKQRCTVKKLGIGAQAATQGDDSWELTVGIEIHAQLNTERKLFSCRLCQSGKRSHTDGHRCSDIR
jgi:hypothetical protein